MSRQVALQTSSYFGLLALVLLIMMAVIVIASDGKASQDVYETIIDAQTYTFQLKAAAAELRWVLFLDSLFIIGFSGAIALAAYGFKDRCLPAAWVAGMGILAVAALDHSENIIMTHSLDLAATSLISTERIVMQAAVSAAKWSLAGVVLVAVSLTLPSKTLLERILVWLPRVALPVGAALFITNPAGLRFAGMPLVLLAMLTGLALLTWVTRTHANQP